MIDLEGLKKKNCVFQLNLVYCTDLKIILIKKKPVESYLELLCCLYGPVHPEQPTIGAQGKIIVPLQKEPVISKEDVGSDVAAEVQEESSTIKNEIPRKSSVQDKTVSSPLNDLLQDYFFIPYFSALTESPGLLSPADITLTLCSHMIRRYSLMQQINTIRKGKINDVNISVEKISTDEGLRISSGALGTKESAFKGLMTFPQGPKSGRKNSVSNPDQKLEDSQNSVNVSALASQLASQLQTKNKPTRRHIFNELDLQYSTISPVGPRELSEVLGLNAGLDKEFYKIELTVRGKPHVCLLQIDPHQDYE